MARLTDKCMLERSIVGSGYRPKNTTGAGGFSLIDGISIESIQKWMDIINKNIWACHPKKTWWVVVETPMDWSYLVAPSSPSGMA